MIWIQPPGTPSMGHLFLDAYHATGDEYYYRAAEQVASALARGAASVGRLELHRRLRRRDVAARSGTTPSARTPGGSRSSSTTTATPPSTMPARRNRRSSSCASTSRRRIRSTRRRSTRRSSSCSTASIRSACGRSAFRAPRQSGLHGLPDYTGYATFNDDVAAENMDFLLMCYQALGDARLLDPIVRGMNAFIVDAARAAAAGLGPAAHARSEAVRRAHLRAERARHAHHGQQHRRC